MAETVLPEGWAVVEMPRMIKGRGLTCVLKMVNKEAGPPGNLLNKMIEIDGVAYQICSWGGASFTDLSYEFTLVEFPPLEVGCPPPKEEAVDHPAHYGGKANPYEAIKVIEALGWGPNFCLGNAMKYLMRAGKKGKSSELEDLKKAVWYINRRIQELETK